MERQAGQDREEIWGLLFSWQVGPHQPVTSVTNWLILYWYGELELGILGRLSPVCPGKVESLMVSQHCNSNTPTIVTTFNLPHSIYITHNTVSRLMFTILCVLLTENTGDNYVLSSYIKILYISNMNNNLINFPDSASQVNIIGP